MRQRERERGCPLPGPGCEDNNVAGLQRHGGLGAVGGERRHLFWGAMRAELQRKVGATAPPSSLWDVVSDDPFEDLTETLGPPKLAKFFQRISQESAVHFLPRNDLGTSTFHVFWEFSDNLSYQVVYGQAPPDM